jgi:hypothetical protein
MKTIKALGIAATVFALASCSSGSNENGKAANDSTTCTEHNHENIVVGVAHEGNYESGKITITTIPGCEPRDFDYSKSDPGKIAAWQAGDTVSIFIDHHHHGEAAHDSITAIKLGVHECTAHSHEGHSHECNGHDHDHNHTH